MCDQICWPRFLHQDYTVGWICALASELTVAIAMLDEEHPPLPKQLHDDNTYTLGRISTHNVVIACLPAGQLGSNAAVAVATQLRYSFPSIQIGLLVGIGGGAPSTDHDIRLGDVVVSVPGKGNGGVIQFDFGRTVAAGRFIHETTVNAPPARLLTAVNKLKAKHAMGDGRVSHWLSALDTPPLRTRYKYQGAEHDILFDADYDHAIPESNCSSCDDNMLIQRLARCSTEPEIHYGTIASGNQVMRHGGTRERWRRESDVLCFEMEGAGLMNTFPCLVIRGICDYADSHKNKRWQEYAAATAAAYAKELLYVIPGYQISTGEAPLIGKLNPYFEGLCGLQGYCSRSLTQQVAVKRRRLCTMAFERDRDVVGCENIPSVLECQHQTFRQEELCGRWFIGQTLCISIPASIDPRDTTPQMGMDSVYHFGAARPQPHVFSISLPSTAQVSLTSSNLVQQVELPSIRNIGVEHTHHQTGTDHTSKPSTSYAYSGVLYSSCPRLGRDVEIMVLQIVGAPSLNALCGANDIHTWRLLGDTSSHFTDDPHEEICRTCNEKTKNHLIRPFYIEGNMSTKPPRAILNAPPSISMLHTNAEDVWSNPSHGLTAASVSAAMKIPESSRSNEVIWKWVAQCLAACIYLSRGDKVQSDLSLQEAKSEFERSITPQQDPKALMALRQMLSVLVLNDQQTIAMTIAQAAFDTANRTLGPDDPMTLIICWLMKVVDFKVKALRSITLRGIHAEFVRRHGQDDPRCITALYCLGYMLNIEREFSTADSVLREAYRLSVAVSGTGHPESILALTTLHRCLVRQGRVEEAIQVLTTAIEDSRDTLGSMHPNRLESMRLLGTLYEKVGNLGETVRLYRLVLDGRIRMLGDNHSFTLGMRHDLEELLRRVGRTTRL